MIIKIKKQKKDTLITKRYDINNKIITYQYELQKKEHYIKFGIKKNMDEQIAQSFNKCIKYNTMYVFNHMKEEIKNHAIEELDKVSNDKKQLEEEIEKMKTQLKELVMEIQELDSAVYKYETLSTSISKDAMKTQEITAEEAMDEWTQNNFNKQE